MYVLIQGRLIKLKKRVGSPFYGAKTLDGDYAGMYHNQTMDNNFKNVINNKKLQRKLKIILEKK